MPEQRADTAQQLIALLRAALHGEPFRADADTDWTALTRLAAKHNLQYAAAKAALEDGNAAALPPELLAQLQKHYLQSLAVCETQRFEARRLMEAFAERGLTVMPIKGVCTRARYPDAPLRSMGDLDFLCRAEQTRAVRAAMQALGYTDFREGRKNDYYRLPPYVLVEMHRELLAAESGQYGFWRDVWDRSEADAELPGVHRMRPEDEYLFNLVHLAEHFREGGAGIRFLMDVWVYERTPLDRAYLDAELGRMGLGDFYDNVRAVAEHWFEETAPTLTPLQERLAAFILDNSVFGDRRNAASLAVRRGRAASLLRVCFPDYESMRSMFPWLAKAPALLPASWAPRGCRALLHRPEQVRHKLDQILHGDREQGRSLQAFFESCGL